MRPYRTVAIPTSVADSVRAPLYLDVDVLRSTDFPIAQNVRCCDGLSFETLSAVFTFANWASLPSTGRYWFAPLVAAPNWRALTVTEVNPDRAPDERETFSNAVEGLQGATRRPSLQLRVGKL